MAESFRVGGVSVAKAMKRVRNFMDNEFVGEDVEVFRGKTDNPLIKSGINEVVIEKLNDDPTLEITVGGADIDYKDIQSVIQTAGGEAPPERELRDRERGSSGLGRTEGSIGTDDGFGSAGMGEVFKPFSHEEAGYVEEHDPEFDGTHPRCKECAHFDDHGNCHIVRDIEPEEYCKNFFADAGFFGEKSDIAPGHVIANLAMYGEVFDWEERDAEEFIEDVAEMISGRING